ncbi:hypothetical protein QE422_002163 [Chryseobacterium sp. SORGH_AS 447]|uniref:hypothetical protein n=1 Tax=Chryseobacterium sp. SORGH_AS_0447 TaxID=3041769 RepID=UPI002787A396|nr:hypothetical protein [Chryseobacterium sp. SORGH_AS_0447]MDQ1161795.1 hypothetical protein [Chryseobacterium sp. SORGH_AS_0447]
MQFIEFKKEHFTHDEEKNNYFLEISKTEIDPENIKVQKKEDDQLSDDLDYEIADHPTRVRVILKEPEDIRVNF